MNSLSFVFLQKVHADEEKVRTQDEHHKILIVGGGTGGITVAAQLQKRLTNDKDVAVVEPSQKHWYQPLWTLVGGGEFPKEKSMRDEASVIPKGTLWLKDAVQQYKPKENCVITKNGKRITYDYLVVATGVEIWWDRIPGLAESVGKNGVSTIYSYNQVDKVWDFGKNFKGGTAIFTMPETPIKCGGAPQKIMYLLEDYWRNQGIRDKTSVMFCLPGASMFGVKKYSDALEKIRTERGIDAKFKHVLTEIKPTTNEAIFKDGEGKKVTFKYDFLHVVPPMGPAKEIRESELAAPNGYVDVNKNTLQHNKFPNVFSLGDVANLPTSKTAAAITLQSPTVVSNLISVMNQKTPTASYNGYSSCPILVGRKQLILAEFLYDGVVKETMPWDQSVPRYSGYLMKKYVFPTSYWSLLLKGNWYGPSLFWPPKN